jgi:hypothetical protein
MAPAAAALPFHRAPADPKEAWAEVGDEFVGTLRFPRRGFITVEEADLISEVDTTQQLYVATCKAAATLATRIDLPATDCYSAITRIQGQVMGATIKLAEEEQQIKIHHSDIIAPLVGMVLESASIITRRRVTAMIRYRLEGCRDWSDADTATLPTTLRDAIHSFHQEEELAMQGEGDPAEQLRRLEADLGKLLPAAFSPPKSTGRKRSGSAGATALAIQPSPATASEGFLSPSSSKRSGGGRKRNGSGSTAQS